MTGPGVGKVVTSGRITVQYHPIAILDRMSNGTEYSTRAAAASAAAAEGGKFAEFHKVLFDNQPAEGSDGLTDAKLVELGRSVGLGDAFAQAVTTRGSLSGTPRRARMARASSATEAGAEDTGFRLAVMLNLPRCGREASTGSPPPSLVVETKRRRLSCHRLNA